MQPRGNQVKCCTPRGSDWMLLPEAIFFRIICHFKKVFALLRNVRGVLENRRSAKRSRWVVLLEVQAWYRRESKWESLGKYIGAAHIGRCYLSHLENDFLQGITPPRLIAGLENVSCGSQPNDSLQGITPFRLTTGLENVSCGSQPNEFLQGNTPPRLTTGLEMSVVAVILDRCIGSWVTNIK